MARLPTPLLVSDLSSFTRSLARALDGRTMPPGHVELQNLIARAAGFRNLQALKATPAPTLPVRAAPAPLTDHARRALMHFDERGRLLRWPSRHALQKLAMWPLWTRFDARRRYTEPEVNAILREANGFDDHARLRRELVDQKLLARKTDCSEYWKLPARPDTESRALLAAWRARQRTRPTAPTAGAARP